MISLGQMVALDEDALICDLAETYGIFDYRSLPAPLVATFAVGLRDNSRIKTKMSGMERPFDEYMLAAIYDGINWLCWSKTKDGAKGNNQPSRIIDLMFGKKETEDPNKTDFELFKSPEEFEKARANLMGE